MSSRRRPKSAVRIMVPEFVDGKLRYRRLEREADVAVRRLAPLRRHRPRPKDRGGEEP